MQTPADADGSRDNVLHPPREHSTTSSTKPQGYSPTLNSLSPLMGCSQALAGFHPISQAGAGAQLSSSRQDAPEVPPGPALPPGTPSKVLYCQDLHQRCSDLQPSPGTHVLVTSPGGAEPHSLTKCSLPAEVAACPRTERKLS